MFFVNQLKLMYKRLKFHSLKTFNFSVEVNYKILTTYLIQVCNIINYFRI